MSAAKVLDSEGRELSPCSEERARELLASGRASKMADEPLTIRLPYAVDLPLKTAPDPSPGRGKRLLLHVCCAPCSTYPLQRLRQEGFQVTGHWCNSNVHPSQEHDRRRASFQAYAQRMNLPVIWDAYDPREFARRVAGREAFRERCRICYRLRLERTAREAKLGGYDSFTTTLLISPHQDQATLREIGQELGRQASVAFHFENFRRGWAERGRLARQYDLYRQEYCGCTYSEREGREAREMAGPRGPGS